MLPLDPLDIEIVLLLNRELSVSRIAQSLGLTTSAVSQRLDRLEERVENKIATRKGVIRLTQAGMEVLRTATQLKMVEQELKRRLLQLKSPLIRIMADHSLLINDIPEALKRMRADMPTLRAELTTGSFNQIIEHVADHKTDVGIIAGQPKVVGLQGKIIRDEHICIMMQHTHQLARKKSIYFRDALAYSMILPTNFEHITAHLQEEAKRVGAPLLTTITAPNFEVQAHTQLLHSNLISPTLESVAKRYQETHNLRYVKLLDDWASNILFAVVREQGSLSDEVNALIKHLVRLNK